MAPTYSCIECDEWVHSKRWALGYRTCRACGERAVRAERKNWCVAPVHKSNTDRTRLIGLNNKGPSQ